MAEDKKTSTKAPKADKPKDKKKSKKNPFKSVVSFFKSVKAEGKKVVWANAKDVLRNTVIVLIVVTVVGLAIYGVDTVLSLGMKGIKSLADKETTTASAQAEDTTNEIDKILENTTAEDTTAKETTKAAE